MLKKIFSCYYCGNNFFIPQNILSMALYKATITQKRGLPGGVFIEKGMSVNFPCIMDPWSMNQANDINNAFIRVYGIDLKKYGMLNRTIVLVEKIN